MLKTVPVNIACPSISMRQAHLAEPVAASRSKVFLGERAHSLS
jgi:hypothetical protein